MCFIVTKMSTFQIIYVAPMKALAAEMVRNFGTRLSPLGVSVKELTGDMQLTKTEIHRTQVQFYTGSLIPRPPQYKHPY